MGTDRRKDQEFSGLLQRDAAGLELLRTPVDEVEKRVVVTGRIGDGAVLEADGVRPA